MEESDLEITLPSDLRNLRIQIDAVSRFIRPDMAAPAVAIALLAQVSRDIEKLLPAVEAWTTELRTERRDRRAAAAKASITRLLAPIRRRRR